MKTIIFNQTAYNISDKLWKKHCIIHPNRSDDALISNLSILFGDTIITTKDIEQSIQKEFQMYEKLSKTVQKAERQYEQINDSSTI